MFEISVHEVPPLVEVCHFTTLPTCPVKPNVPKLLVEHKGKLPLVNPTMPPTEGVKQVAVVVKFLELIPISREDAIFRE